LGAIAVTAIYLEFPNMKPRAAARRLDWWGCVTLIGCVVPLLLALTWATQYGWTSVRVESLLALASMMLCWIAALYPARQAARQMPVEVFRS